MTFLSMNAHKNNANGRLSQEKWLRSGHFVTMVTCRHTSPLYKQPWNLQVLVVWPTFAITSLYILRVGSVRGELRMACG